MRDGLVAPFSGRRKQLRSGVGQRGSDVWEGWLADRRLSVGKCKEQTPSERLQRAGSGLAAIEHA